jgi:hypothetical protein
LLEVSVERDRSAGPRWEADGHWHEDAERLETGIFYLLGR